MPNYDAIFNQYKASNPQPTASSVGGSDWYSQVQAGGYRPTLLPSDQTTNQPSFSDRLNQDLLGRYKNIVSSYGREQAGQQSRAGTLLDAAGETLGMLSDAGKEAFKSLPQSFQSAISSAPNIASEAAMPGSNLLSSAGLNPKDAIVQNVSDAWNQFKQSHPQAAQHLESLGNIGGAALTAYGGGEALARAPELVGAAQDVIKNVAGKIKEGATGIKSAIGGTASKTAESFGVKPEEMITTIPKEEVYKLKPEERQAWYEDRKSVV